MNIFRAGLLALLLGCTACTSAPAPMNDLTAIRADERVIEGQLDNGLRYRLVPTTDEPGRLDVRLRVGAGSLDEDDGQAGVAHLLEHLLFYNRDPAGTSARQRLQQAGWRQGLNFNALTSPERTLYMFSPPAGTRESDLALEVLAQMVLRQNFNAADLDNERPIVVEEWRGGLGVAQRMNDQRRDSQRMGSRYVGRPPIGSQAAIESARVEALHAFQQRWYVPGNMQLNIVGDFVPAELIGQIEAHFADAMPRPLPPRDLDFPLMPGLKAVRLQDSESGSHQVTLLLRGHHAANRLDSLDGQRERLLDRITARLLLTQLQRQSRPDGVRSFTMQRAQFGERSEVIALSAALQESVHDQALQTLLTEIQRLRRFGLQQSELDLELVKLRGVGERMLERGDERNFAEWVQLLTDPSNADSRVQTRSDIARNALALLDGIQLDDINAQLRRWLAADDWVLQYSAPTQAPLALPDAARLRSMLDAIDVDALAPPVPAKAEQPLPQTLPELPAATGTGRILEARQFTEQGVHYWQLSNGDRFVWLKRPGKAHLQIDSASGYRQGEETSWTAQIASQLVWASPPAGFDALQWKAWQQRNALRLSLDQQATRSVFSATLEPADTQALLAFYRARINHPSLPEEALQQSRNDLLQQQQRSQPSVRQQQDQALSRLRFAGQPSRQPDTQRLAALDRQTLLDSWRSQMAAPVTYYLLADVEETALRQWVSRELASIPRGQAPSATPLLQAPGQRHQQLAASIEPRANLQVFSFAELPWTPEDAVRVAQLRRIASDALKQRLRAEARGLYNLSFDSELNADSGRLESQLLFSCDPERLDELWQQAQAVLRELPGQLDEAQLARLRKELAKQEKQRQVDNASQLHRLVLSDRRWGDPRYLSSQKQLPDALELQAMKRLAALLLTRENQARLALLPRPSAD